MGKFLKTTGVAIIAFGLAASAHAASYAEECDCSVWVPKHDGGFRFGLEALYYAPSITHTEYVRTINTAVTSLKTFNVNPDYQWGYQLDGQYMWGGTGNDVTLSFLDIHLSERAKLNKPTTGVFDLPSVSPFAPTVYTDHAKMCETFQTLIGFPDVTQVVGKFDVDHIAIDLEFGQAIAAKNRVTMRFHGGLRYAQVDAKMRQAFVDGVSGVPGVQWLSITDRSNFEGIGPRFGTDASVDLSYGFKVVGGFSAAVLVGDVDVKNTAEIVDENKPNNNQQARHLVSYDHRIVLAHDARLGLRYDWDFNGGMEMGLEFGYHATNYTDVDHKVSTAGTDIGTNGAYLRVDLLI